MRTILYTLALALLPILAQANHIKSNLEGFWESHETHTTIKVKIKRYGFKVKGLYRSNRYTRYSRNYKGTYVDSRGNKLLIQGRNRIVFVNRHNGIKTRFRRQKNTGNRYRYDETREGRNYSEQYHHCGESGYGQYDDGYYRGDNANRDRRAERRSKTDTRRNTLNFNPAKIDDQRLRKMEGTWRNQGSKAKKVIIVSTRDGIKVKDTTNDKWYIYRLSDDRRSLVDPKGNVYQVDGQSLYWTAKNGKRVLRLEKISSDTF